MFLLSSAAAPRAPTPALNPSLTRRSASPDLASAPGPAGRGRGTGGRVPETGRRGEGTADACAPAGGAPSLRDPVARLASADLRGKGNARAALPLPPSVLRGAGSRRGACGEGSEAKPAGKEEKRVRVRRRGRRRRTKETRGGHGGGGGAAGKGPRILCLAR